MKKLFALLLVCFAVVACFTSCDSEQPPEVTVSGEQLRDYGDIAGDFSFLLAGNWDFNDFEADEASEEVVDKAIYERTKTIESNYGVKISTNNIYESHSSTGSGTGFMKVYSEYSAGTSSYDATFIGAYDVATLAYNGMLWDLNRIPYIDLTKDHWDQRANEDLGIRGKMYYTTGDISLSDNRATYTLFFSKKMVEDFGLASPYDLVNNNEWTLEKFAEMTKSVGSDANQDGNYNENDIFGLLTPNDTNLAILSAADERISRINENGEIELSLYNDRVVRLYDNYNDLIHHTSVLNYQRVSPSPSSETRIAMLDNNQALFYSHTMFYIDYLRECENDFGILPYPKLDATQENYKNLVSAWHASFVCIPLMAKNPTRSGAVLEELAILGKEKVTPAYYDKTLQGKRARDIDSLAMLDIIFDNLVYDIGAYYNIGTYKDELSKLAVSNKSLTTIYETYKLQAQNKIDTINANFLKQQ